MFRRKPLTDGEIVTGVLKGRRDLFSQLVERYLPVVHAVAYAKVGNRSEAEDIAQEAFLRGYQSLSDLREPGKFGSWIRGIARNVAGTAMRKRASQEAIRRNLAETLPEAFHSSPERDELHALLRSQVMAMDEDPREVLLLYYFAGNSIREMAESLEISTEAAKKRLQRARDQLSAKMLNELAPALMPEGPSKASKATIITAIAGMSVAWDAAASSAGTGLGTGTVVGGTIVMKKVVAISILAVAGVVGVWVATDPGETNEPLGSTETTANVSSQAVPDMKLADASPVDLPDQEVHETSVEPAVTAEPISKPSAVDQPKPVLKGKGFFRGKVLDPDGRPANGASVVLRAVHWERPSETAMEEIATADNTGQFEFANLAMGWYAVSATGPGTAAYNERRLNEEKPETDVVLNLTPAGSISGVVRSEAGAPIAGATVFPYEREGHGYRWNRNLAVAARATTDANGVFELSNIAAPAWKLCAKADGYATKISEYVPLGSKSADIRMAGGGSIHGVVVLKGDGSPVAGAEVGVREKHWVDDFETKTDKDGAFKLANLNLGDYWLRVDKANLVPATGPVQVTVVKSDTPNGLHIELSEGGVISGRVYDAETGEGLAGQEVAARTSETAQGPEREAKTDADGVYRLEGLLAAAYNISADRPEEYIDPGFSNEKSATAKPGTVVDGIDFPTSKGLSITGRVVDAKGRPVEGVRVDPNHGPWQVNDTTDAEGLFTLGPVEPTNRMFISAKKSGMVGAPQGPFRVQPPGLDGIELVVEEAASISGVLVDGDDNPVSGMKLLAWPTPSPGGTTLPDYKTGADGTFHFDDLFGGTYMLVAQPPGSHSIGNNELDRITVEAGEDVRDVTLVYDEEDGFVIAGRVTTHTGEPVSGVAIECRGPVSGANKTDADGYYRVTRLSEGQYIVYSNGRPDIIPRDGVMAGDENVDFVVAEEGVLEGTVLAADTGAPIESFSAITKPGRVSALDAWEIRRFSRSTQQGGQFTFTLPAGEHTVFVRAPGYQPTSQTVVVPPEREGPELVELRLQPGRQVSIQVADTAGSPISGARLYTGEIQFNDAWPENSGAELGATGPDGVYMWDSVSPDDTAVFAYYPGYAPASAVVPTGGGHVSIVLQGGGILVGTITMNGELLPLDNAGIVVTYPDDPAMGELTFAIDDPVYRVEGVPAGRAEVRAMIIASRDPYAGRQLSKPAVIQSGSTTNIDFPFVDQTGRIEGRVHAGGHAIRSGTLEVEVQPVSGPVEHFRVSSGNTGYFTIENVPAGTATIDVQLWEHPLPRDTWRERTGLVYEVSADQTTEVDIDFGE
jgi:RNA polymerase sigma factor (sigma-70 family)